MDDRWITDWTPSERFPLYTRANAGEIMPEPCSPIGWDLVWGGGVAFGWADGVFRFGAFTPDETDPDQPDFISCFGGYLYLNASLIRLQGERTPGMSAEAMDAAFLGNHPDVPPYLPQPGDRRPELEAQVQETMNWIMGATEEPVELAEDRARVLAICDSRPDLAAATDAELVVRARAMTQPIRDVFERYYVYGTASSFGPGILGELCSPVDPSLPGRLISGMGDIDSAPPAQSMWDLSRTVRASSSLGAAFDEGIDGLIERLATVGDGPTFLDAVADVQRTHGARGPGEWDPASPTWELDSNLILVAVDRMRFADDDLSPAVRYERATADRTAAEAEARAAFAGNDEALATLEAGLNVCRVMIPTRERTKLTQMLVVHEVRMPMYELGRRMVQRGVLDRPRQVFMLLDAELDQFIEEPGGFSDTLRQREADLAELAERQEPFIVNGEVPPLSQWPQRDRSAEPVREGEELTGIPGSPGIAIGPARVITDPSDARGLEPGEVLIAPLTDPAWTPLFVPAAAVVVEVGAPMSHAVIVSREFGVPCVTGVFQAASRIPDGAIVSVDGNTGQLVVVELPG